MNELAFDLQEMQAESVTIEHSADSTTMIMDDPSFGEVIILLALTVAGVLLLATLGSRALRKRL